MGKLIVSILNSISYEMTNYYKLLFINSIGLKFRYYIHFNAVENY